MAEPPRDFKLPSPEELRVKKTERLNAAFSEEDRIYLPDAIKKQLGNFVTKDNIYPANAVPFLQERAKELQALGIPPAIFKLDRAQLPRQTAPSNLDYAPIDYLTAAYPTTTLFPLLKLAGMGEARVKQEQDGLDPIVRRELMRKGLLQRPKRLTKLDPRSPDVKSLRAAERVEYIVGIIKTAVRCYGNSQKTTLFIKVVRARLGRRAEHYNRESMNKRQVSSLTAAELTELIEPDNLHFLMDALHQRAGAWIEAEFPHEAPITHLGQPSLDQILHIFNNNIFWFADWPERDIEQLLRHWRETLMAKIEQALVAHDKRTIAGYANSVLTTDSEADYVHIYLDTSLQAMVADAAEKSIAMHIEGAEIILHDTLRGGDLPVQIQHVIDEIIAELEETKSVKDKPDDTPPTGMASSPVVDLAEYRRNLEARLPSQPTSTVIENLKIFLEDIITNIEFTPAEFKARYIRIFYPLAKAYIKALLYMETDTVVATDLYSPSERYSKLRDVCRLGQRILGDETTSVAAVCGLIDDELMRMTDPQFASIYNALSTNHSRGPFSKFIFAEEYGHAFSTQQHSNSLPKARQRLVNLLTQQNPLFSKALLASFERWKKAGASST